MDYVQQHVHGHSIHPRTHPLTRLMENKKRQHAEARKLKKAKKKAKKTKKEKGTDKKFHGVNRNDMGL